MNVYGGIGDISPAPIATCRASLAHAGYGPFAAPSQFPTFLQRTAHLAGRHLDGHDSGGMAGFASQIPVFLLAPIGGVVAGRFNRHRVVIATQASSMVLASILSYLTLTKRVTVIDVITLAALMGCVNAFDIPARQAFLVDMVGREDLMNAIALNSSMFNGARVVGPSVAGILVASIGEGWCFF